MAKLNSIFIVFSLALSSLGATAVQAQTATPGRASLPATTTSSEHSANLQAALNYAAFWNTGETQYADAALADDFIDRSLPTGRPQGKTGALLASANFRKAVPDLRANLEELIVSGEKVVLRLRFTGHFSGQLGQIQGRGQAIDFAAFDLYRVVNGKIRENWHLEDMHKFFQQIQ